MYLDMFCALDSMIREDDDKMIYTCTVGRYATDRRVDDDA